MTEDEDMRKQAGAQARERRGVGADTSFHGDLELFPGCLDFAVNVRGSSPPPLMAEGLREELGGIASYPPERRAAAVTKRIADLHGVGPDEVLLLSGGAEGFALLPALGASALACLMPGFTEPLNQARRAGFPARPVILAPPFDLPHSPDELALRAGEALVLGNPCNPTSRLYGRSEISSLADRDGITVVDEAFMDVALGGAEVAGGRSNDEPEDEPDTLAGARLPGVLVLRSLTKTWSLAGLRVGYAVGDPALIRRMSARLPHWHLGSLQLRALEIASSAEGRTWLAGEKRAVAAELSDMCTALREAGIRIALAPQAPFVLVTAPSGISAASLHSALAERGIAVRRCNTFPGLDSAWGGERCEESHGGYLRLAVRPIEQVERLVAAWKESVHELSEPSRR